MRRRRFAENNRAFFNPDPSLRTPGQVRAERAAMMKMRRTEAQLILNSGVGQPKFVVQALLILSELTPTGVRVFAQTGFNRDQKLTVNIPGLQSFFAKGRVVGCKEVPLNHSIVTQRVFRYWVDIDFEFSTDVERQAVMNYCQFLTGA